ncbi:hypothetical protein SAURM35S_07654 [Streptomyces aurantiogriseus]
MPGQGRLLQQPHRHRAAPPLVVRGALRAQQRPREAVGLLGAYAGDAEQLPGVLGQDVLGALTEHCGDLRCQPLGSATAGQHTPYGVDGLRGRARRSGRSGFGGHRLRAAYRLRGRAARGRLGLGEDGCRGLLATLHGPDGREQVGGLPTELGPCLDGRLLLGLAPLDPLPLQLLSGELGLRLGELGSALAPAVAARGVRLFGARGGLRAHRGCRVRRSRRFRCGFRRGSV